MNKFLSTALGRLRLIAFVEGVSFLILLFIATGSGAGLPMGELGGSYGSGAGIAAAGGGGDRSPHGGTWAFDARPTIGGNCCGNWRRGADRAHG